MNAETIPVSDYHKLAVLDLHRIQPTKTQHDGRFWAHFPKEQAEKILADYESGMLTVVARDFVSSIERVKNRIFESERALKARY